MDATFHLEHAVFNYRVAAVYIKNGHILLHKQVTDPFWILPGGRVKVLEDSQTSLIREMEEELGLTVKVNELLWMTENFFDYKNKNYHELGFYYRISCDDPSLEVNKDSFFGIEDEHLIYQWIPLDQLANIVLYPEFLNSALNELPDHPKHLIIDDIRKQTSV